MPKYVLTGVNTLTGKTEYVGLDSASGGYPYWTDDIQSASLRNTVDGAWKDSQDYLSNSCRDICLAEVRIEIIKLSSADSVAAMTKAAEAEIAKIHEKLSADLRKVQQ